MHKASVDIQPIRGFLGKSFFGDRVNSAGLVSKRLYRAGLGEPARLRSRIRGAKHLFYTRFGWFVHPPWVGFFVLLYPTRPSVPSHYSDFLIPFVFHPFVLLFTLHV